MPEFAKIKTWPSCEINGMVFVWYHCDRIEPTWTIPEKEEITKKQWVYQGRTEHYVNAHIEVSVLLLSRLNLGKNSVTSHLCCCAVVHGQHSAAIFTMWCCLGSAEPGLQAMPPAVM